MATRRLINNKSYTRKMHTVIDSSQKVLYIHIPKCASTSIKRAMSPVKGIPKFNELPKWKEKWSEKFPVYMQIMPVEEFNASPYFKFAVLRDPLSRFYSGMYQIFRTIPPREDLLDALHWMRETPWHKLDPHVRPQVTWLQHRQLDRIFGIKNLKEDWKDMMEQFGYSQLGHKNAFPLYREKVSWDDPEISRLVQEVYAQDYELRPK